MNAQVKTRRRLILFSAVGLVIACAVALGVRVQNQRHASFLQADRTEGIEAARMGHYKAAKRKLTRYCNEIDSDAEALLSLAIATELIPQKGNEHLTKSRSLFRRVLNLDPGNPIATYRLLSVNNQLGDYDQILTHAKQVLAHEPNNIQAWGLKARALASKRKWADAEIAAAKLVVLEPQSLAHRLMLLEMISHTSDGKTRAVNVASLWYNSSPNTAMFALTLAVAQNAAGLPRKSADWLKKAMAYPGPHTDPLFGLEMVARLDHAKMNAVGGNWLARHPWAVNEPRHTHALIERLWIGGHHKSILRLLSKASAEQQSNQVLAIWTFSARMRAPMKQKSVPEIALQQRVQQRGLSPSAVRAQRSAVAWSSILGMVGKSKTSTSIGEYDLAILAALKDLEQPVLRYCLGTHYKFRGETEPAIRQWRRVVKANGNWADVHLRLAEAYNETGRPRLAGGHASTALRLSHNLAAVHQVALAWLGLNRAVRIPQSGLKLANLLGESLKVHPDNQQTRLLYIQVLIRVGKLLDAKKQIQLALDAKSSTNRTQMLISLSDVSVVHGLGLEESLLREAISRDPVVPNAALGWALHLARTNRSVEGRKYLYSTMKTNTSESSPTWRLIWCRYLDVTNDPQALNEWKAFAFAGQLAPDVVSRSILAARQSWQDKQLIRNAIDQLKANAHADSVTWRLAEARFLLTESNDKALRSAIALLEPIVERSPTRIEPRLLLATAKYRVGEAAEAAEHLKKVTGLRPGDTMVLLQLADIRIRQGDRVVALELIHRVLKSPLVQRSGRVAAASLLARLGKWEQAISVMTKAYGTIEKAPPSLALADWLYRLNRTSDADRVYRQLLAKPSVSNLASYAKFLVATGKTSEAEQVLRRVDGLKVDTGVRECLHAQFQTTLLSTDRDSPARRKRITRIEGHYQRAVKADPAHVPTWRRWLMHRLRYGTLAEVQSLVREAIKALPADPVFTFFQKNGKSIHSAGGGRLARRILIEQVGRPALAPAHAESLEWIGKIRLDRSASGPAANDLERVVTDHPDSAAMAELLIEVYQLNRSSLKAVWQARRIARTFPTDAHLAQLLVGVLERYGRWEEVRDATERWRQLVAHAPLPPQTAAARALVELNRPQAALDRLTPLIQFHRNKLDPISNTFSVYIRALIAARKIPQAEQQLFPMFSKSARWRQVGQTAAMQWIGDPSVSLRWMKEIGRSIASTAKAERLDWQFGYIHIARRFKLPDVARSATSSVRSAANSSAMTADHLARWGAVLLEAGEYRESEMIYRRALKKNPKHTLVLNNLAFLMADRPGDRAAALKMAQEAIRLETAQWASPRLASFHDTMAYVLLKLKRNDEAIKHLQRAVQLDPKSLDWVVALTEAYLANGARRHASDRYGEIRLKLLNDPPLSTKLRWRIDQIASRLGRSVPKKP